MQVVNTIRNYRMIGGGQFSLITLTFAQFESVIVEARIQLDTDCFVIHMWA
jgi:hypothetical protein